MIQRIQTLWLLVASLLAFATISVTFFSGSIMIDNVKTFVRFSAKTNILLLIMTIILALAPLVAIFMYKDRKMQVRIASGAMILSILNLGIYYWQSRNYLPEDLTFAIPALVAIAIPFVLFLAIRGIYRDDKLMKSLDRLR